MRTNTFATNLFSLLKPAILGTACLVLFSSCGDPVHRDEDSSKALTAELVNKIVARFEKQETPIERENRIHKEEKLRAQIFVKALKDAGFYVRETPLQPPSPKTLEKKPQRIDEKPEIVRPAEPLIVAQPIPAPIVQPVENFVAPAPQPEIKNPQAPPPPPPPPGLLAAPRIRPAGAPAWAKINPTLFSGFNVAGKDLSSEKAKQLRMYLGEVEIAPERFDSMFAYFGLVKKPAEETSAEKVIRERQVFYFGPPLLALDGTEINEASTATPEGRAKFWQAVFGGPSPLAHGAGNRLPLDRISGVNSRIDPAATSASKSIIITTLKPFERFLVYDKSDAGEGFAYEGMKALSESLADVSGGSIGIAAGANDAARGGVWFWFRKNTPIVEGETPAAMRKRFDAIYDDFLANGPDGESFQEWYTPEQANPA